MFEARANEDPYRFVARVFCGRGCSDRRGEVSDAEKRAYILDRSLPEPNSGCWLWTAGITRGGYGLFCCGPDKRRAPRASFALFKAEIPAGLIVRHTCDTPACVNPDHLILGTVKQNSEDAVERGQQVSGSRHRHAKLNEAEVAAILADERRQAAIAREYGVSTATVSLIKSRKQWKHVKTAEASL